MKGSAKLSVKAKSPKRKIAKRNGTKVAVPKVGTDPYRATFAMLLRQIARRSSAGDATSTETLWAAFNWIAGVIAMVADQQAPALDNKRLFNVTVRCGHMLKVALGRADHNALRVALALAEVGCELLRQAAEKDSEFVASFAEKAPTWPVMMATKASYHTTADKYLRAIRVGTKSVPRTTAGTHIDVVNSRSSELAVMILNTLCSYDSVLRRKVDWPKGSVRTAEQNLRATAMKFREVLKLPPLNTSTQRQWWEVGKRILAAYWIQHPEKARGDIAFLGKGRRDPYKSDKTQAIGLVRRAFYTAVKLAGST